MTPTLSGGVMPNRTDRLLKADDVSIIAKAERDGKIRVTSKSWDEPVIVLANQVLELRHDRSRCLAGQWTLG